MTAYPRLAAAIAASALVVAVSSPALAAPAYPAPHGRCVDQVGVLGAELCDRVTGVLRADERVTTDEIAVAVVPTTGDATIEEWSTGLFNRWRVGKAGKNNGVLLVVAVDDHKVRLETGTGMARRLDDTAAAGIVDDVITPELADERYADGILRGLDEVRRHIGHKIATGAELAGLAPAEAGGTDLAGTEDISLYDDEVSGGSGAPSWLPVAGLALVGLIGIGLLSARSRRAPAPAGAKGPRVRGWADHPHHPADRSHAADGAAASAGFLAASTYDSFSSSGSSSSDSSSSSSSSSDFGGGFSDGGGGSGSW
ncbi:TPM domain-containing protein [Actinoplanes regularis]|uniref:TPM domain-containing protein n=1 Tax=Actinoplanes regularis TaxID=52697 RepID=A0A239HSV5_9ACTN|nr:TPM domain-containing protein [Actinoplanes regularis]GIE91193.1 hypothetical protein Are01nite_76730 [Actinoplanes regularis]SNS84301.1 uncharacterized protein SAMN06264365_1265 [Actinoplanes regularis]